MTDFIEFGSQCEHGSLTRACEICYRDREISRLTKELSASQEALRSYTEGFDGAVSGYSKLFVLKDKLAWNLAYSLGWCVEHHQFEPVPLDEKPLLQASRYDIILLKESKILEEEDFEVD